MARSLSPIGIQQDLSGRIFDIQSYSVHDGPGCRTLVFLSGCPLRCEWCANPEGLENRVRTLFRVMKCINRTQGCTRCIPKCPHQAISISDEKEIVKHLIEQVTGSVRWRESVNYMADQGVTDVVELGAGKVLSGIIKRSHKEINAVSVGSVAEIEALAKDL